MPLENNQNYSAGAIGEHEYKLQESRCHWLRETDSSYNKLNQMPVANNLDTNHKSNRCGGQRTFHVIIATYITLFGKNGTYATLYCILSGYVLKTLHWTFSEF
ncbi:hypothetical protein V1264_010985 [Littorina saxatilis]|uniref:Uncharacterized protein n=1 Tax=Littorina saxatilis TaxID=31220 RepID=A0AAN9GKI6_9CAEN